MRRPHLDELTLREKIGQTGFPGVRDLRLGVINNGGYAEYLTKYPFTGLYADHALTKDNVPFESRAAFAETLVDAQNRVKIPFIVMADMEYGANAKFKELHRIPANMSIGAACSEELAYKRAKFFAKEAKSMGVNCLTSPVLDLLNNFFDVMGVRCLSSDPEIIEKLAPSIIRGIEDEGLATSPKHFPGSGYDYRDTHFCYGTQDMTKEEWFATYGKIWKAAVDAGARTFMVSHNSFPAIDDSLTSLGVPRPATASKKVLDLLRVDLGFNGVIITDAVAMKGCAAAFEHDDVYIECFNAGNDIVLFVNDDYIDVMEKAVLDGRVSMERLNESVERILDLKESLGLFDEIKLPVALTEEENLEFDAVNFEIAKKALTLVSNKINAVPFDAKKVKKALIVAYSPYEPFQDAAAIMKDEFERRGVEAKVVDHLESKDELKEFSEEYDIIVYACYLAMSQPQGMSFYSKDLSTLFYAFAYGSEKSVAASFGAPSIYYNYFESVPTFINAYSMDASTMRAFVGALLGDFEMTGKSPVDLKPNFVKRNYK